MTPVLERAVGCFITITGPRKTRNAKQVVRRRQHCTEHRVLSMMGIILRSPNAIMCLLTPRFDSRGGLL
jgi:hypothetical protein